MLTFEATENGYTILKDGEPWIKQDAYIPYPGETMEQSAQNHINALLSDSNSPPRPSEIEQLRAENAELKLALAELAEALEQERLNTQLALAELAESMMGGNA